MGFRALFLAFSEAKCGALLELVTCQAPWTVAVICLALGACPPTVVQCHPRR